MPNLLIRRAFAPASAPTTPYDVRAALAGAGATIVDDVLFPARPARHQAPPGGLPRQVEQLLRAGSPLYTHQAKAIALAETGHNVVLATRTASGKTRVATAAAMIRLLRDPHARVLCLYPTKALQADQEQKWRAATRGLDLPTVVLSGDTSSSDRVRLLEQSRIILANPDIMHSWWMAHLADPRLQSILATVALIFVDEAHVYEGAFGSNVAMLMRRLRAVLRLAGGALPCCARSEHGGTSAGCNDGSVSPDGVSVQRLAAGC
jgi:DEAD/DEAH box helicase domain-containing protein